MISIWVATTALCCCFVGTGWIFSLLWALQALVHNMNDAGRTPGSKHHIMKCAGGTEKVRNKRSSDKHNIGALLIYRLLVLAGFG